MSVKQVVKFEGGVEEKKAFKNAGMPKWVSDIASGDYIVTDVAMVPGDGAKKKDSYRATLTDNTNKAHEKVYINKYDMYIICGGSADENVVAEVEIAPSFPCTIADKKLKFKPAVVLSKEVRFKAAFAQYAAIPDAALVTLPEWASFV